MGSSLSTTYVPSWQDACASRFNCSSDGLVNILGQAISCPANGTIQSTPDIWGITYNACEAECTMDKIRQTISFASAMVPLTTWVLPWVALIAQLPFEAAGGWMDLLSACLCVGSPALATYSLALTAFNRRYIAAEFKRLKEEAETTTQRRYRYMAPRIDAACFVLQETQQCPMRADQRAGEFANLIVLPDRRTFWITAEKDLKNTSRGFTKSFLAQMILAFMSYLISFIAAVHDSLGSPDVGLQFASSSVWSWMFPIVFGYIRVGSQCQAGAIKEALVDNIVSTHEDLEVMPQTGLRPDADLYRPLSSSETGGQNGSTDALPSPATSTRSSKSWTNIPLLTTNARHQHQHSAKDRNLRPVRLPTPLWMDVRGDERLEGPIFNYARIFTSFAFAGHVTKAFENSLSEFRIPPIEPVDTTNAPGTPVTLYAISEGPTTPPGGTSATTPLSPPGTAADVLLMTAQDAAYCCGLDLSQDLPAFMSWKDISETAAFQHIFRAALLALFLQWGTTGAALYVAYKTPTVGIGCRSGSYLIYGIAATVSWVLLVISQFVSHELMKRLERNPMPTLCTTILGWLAVIIRLAGKAIAIANAGWLIASSVLEEIGVFQTCWCQTDAFQYHTTGWTPVFKGAADLRNAASDTWIGGFAWSIGVSLATAIIFNA
ncbi:hypothetical protein MSAN_01107400 [Mycena sanguinolenta]|uniref:Uncharacterized protein n=1 Tax=Mycena sanguinolenta TaxID=230812 RepID=A0A8H6YV69_9AGAR|nr:hypothetical protein MSAN_01107400 [Mycena sanguinolenta]